MAAKKATKSKTKVKAKSKVESQTGEVTLTKTEMRRADQIRKGLKEAKEKAEQSYLVLAEGLHEVHKNMYYKQWDHDSFENYCNDELDFQYRKADYLVKIWRMVTDLDLDKKEVAAIGWSKMATTPMGAWAGVGHTSTFRACST